MTRTPLSERIAMLACFALLPVCGWMIVCPEQFTAAVMAVIS